MILPRTKLLWFRLILSRKSIKTTFNGGLIQSKNIILNALFLILLLFRSCQLIQTPDKVSLLLPMSQINPTSNFCNKLTRLQVLVIVSLPLCFGLIYSTISIAQTSQPVLDKSSKPVLDKLPIDCPDLPDPKNPKNIKEWSRLTEPETYCIMPPRPSPPPCFGEKDKDKNVCKV
jgi:hypothetical protein